MSLRLREVKPLPNGQGRSMVCVFELPFVNNMLRSYRSAVLGCCRLLCFAELFRPLNGLIYEVK